MLSCVTSRTLFSVIPSYSSHPKHSTSFNRSSTDHSTVRRGQAYPAQTPIPSARPAHLRGHTSKRLPLIARSTYRLSLLPALPPSVGTDTYCQIVPARELSLTPAMDSLSLLSRRQDHLSPKINLAIINIKPCPCPSYPNTAKSLS